MKLLDRQGLIPAFHEARLPHARCANRPQRVASPVQSTSLSTAVEPLQRPTALLETPPRKWRIVSYVLLKAKW